MATHLRPRRFLTLDELAPNVDLASCRKFEKDYWFRYRVPSHHFILIESGCIEAKTPDGVFHGKAGDLLCFRPTDWNEYGNIGLTLFYQAHVHFAAPPRWQRTPILDECGPLPVQVSLGPKFEEMRRVFETFCIEMLPEGVSHRLRLQAAVFELLAIVTCALTPNPAMVEHLDAWQRCRLRLDTELNREISLAAMAGAMNLSRYYFNRAFKQRFGRSPKAYHLHARLCEGARLLRSTNLAIKAIAFDLGFSSDKAFTHLFRKHLGVLPSDLRHGEAPADEAAPNNEARLFPMNRELVPLKDSLTWYQQYVPKRHGPDYQMQVEWKPKHRAAGRK